MITKVLIANRGEIALRAIRACKELGIKSLAVYSEADLQSLPIQLADEAICIGSAPASLSYLKPDRILSAAAVCNADAVYPGYGFLSENATFAEQCTANGIKFIGPSAKTIKCMGDKVMARQMAKKAGVPIIPGSDTITDERKGLKVANKIGYPVIIKAAGGGGGKGIRVANNNITFIKELRAAQMEAEKAFSNPAVYIEKYIEDPRHIEIQVLADSYGHAIHVGERDCSLQRNHQKLIEEAPSTFLDKNLRERMGKAAIKLVKKCQYEGAGTVEFLVDKHGNFYFIEMNTRIQVEHTVTEEAMGIDLVQWQLRIANKEHLTLQQKDIKCINHAIECRINAEDPDRNFAPCPGTITFYHEPGGRGIRIDSHVYQGYSIPMYYDSMIGKLIAIGANREEAIKRMQRALDECMIGGVKTSIPLCKKLISDPDFQAGRTHTHFIEAFLKKANAPQPDQKNDKVSKKKS
ncbi:MAG: acetyl-CoA carboxylase biotin carboxylase subunit [Opitutales bacterium]|nr:acetyl-CoA carboxylase biotin carboxylase subunit [Opitutales bacterium]